MRRRETEAEYRERMRRFNAAKERYEFFDTGLGMLLPDRAEERQRALSAMWDDANAPAADEYRKRVARG